MSRGSSFGGPPFLAHLSPGTPGLRGLVACLVLWVPLLTGAMDLAFGGARDIARRWVVSAAIGDTVCLVCFGGAIVVREIVAAVAKRRGRPDPPRGAGIYFAFSALLMPCVLPAGLLVGAKIGAAIGRPYAPDAHAYRVGIGFGVIMIALFFLYRARTEERERVKDLENANLRAQLAALTAEMNPHMLFNTLNTIASLVHDKPDLAEATVLDLASLYRASLRASSDAMHPLRDELALCDAYLRIERARFGERLDVSVHVDESVDPGALRVPVLILQPLVENAVKHGIAPRASGGKIALRVSPDRGGQAVAVIVEDDGVGLAAASPTRDGNGDGNGRALANCAERLRLVYSDASLHVTDREEGGTRACIVIPRGGQEG